MEVESKQITKSWCEITMTDYNGDTAFFHVQDKIDADILSKKFAEAIQVLQEYINSQQ